MKIKLTILLIFISLLSFSQQIIIPEQYQKLRESPSNGKEIKTISLKMDDDDFNDFAIIIVDKESNCSYKLLIYISSLNKTFEVEYINDLELGALPLQLKKKKNVLMYSYYTPGTGGNYREIKLRYNKTHKKVQIIGYDFGHKVFNGHVDNSYNLLTGDYILKKTCYGKINCEPKLFKGNKKSKKTFLRDVSIRLFKKLDKIGNDF